MNSTASDYYVSDFHPFFKQNYRNSFSDKYNTYKHCSSSSNTRPASAESKLVKRSFSLNSLRGFKRPIQRKNIPHEEYNDRNILTGSNRSLANHHSESNDFELPSNIIAQLEESMLHRNLKRDSFRSRNGTNNFVVNPIFNEKNE